MFSQAKITLEEKKYWFWDENIYWFLVGEIYWFCDKKIYWFCDEEILKSKFREIFTLRGTFINGKIVQNFESVICSICKKCICLNLRESDLLNFQKMHLHPWSPLLLPWSLRRQVWLLQIIFLQFHPFLWFHAISIMSFLNSNCVFYESSSHQIEIKLHQHII